jgi:hypothetical protein
MIKLSNLIKEIKVNKPGSSRVYIGEPNKELFQIENFPSIRNIDGIPYDHDEKENPEFWRIIYKIEEYLQDSGINNIKFIGNFSSPNPIAYIYIDGEGNYTIVDSLKQFYEGWQTEEDWRVENWKSI